MADKILPFQRKDIIPNQSRENMKPIPDQLKGGRHLYAIRDNQNTKVFEKAILFDLTSFCDLGENATFQDWIWRKKEDWIKDLGMEEKTLNKWIKILIKKEYLLERHGYRFGRRSANEYQLTSKIFDEYLINRAPPNLDPLNNSAPPNLDPLAPPKTEGLAPPNLDPIYNSPSYNNDEYNELKNKQKETSGIQESGEDPLYPSFSDFDYSFGFKKEEEVKPKRTKAEVFKAGHTAIRERKGEKFLSREEKAGMIQTLLDQYDIDKVFNFFDKTNKNHQAAPYDIKLLKMGIEEAAKCDSETI